MSRRSPQRSPRSPTGSLPAKFVASHHEQTQQVLAARRAAVEAELSELLAEDLSNMSSGSRGGLGGGYAYRDEEFNDDFYTNDEDPDAELHALEAGLARWRRRTHFGSAGVESMSRLLDSRPTRGAEPQRSGPFRAWVGSGPRGATDPTSSPSRVAASSSSRVQWSPASPGASPSDLHFDTTRMMGLQERLAESLRHIGELESEVDLLKGQLLNGSETGVPVSAGALNRRLVGAEEELQQTLLMVSHLHERLRGSISAAGRASLGTFGVASVELSETANFYGSSSAARFGRTASPHGGRRTPSPRFARDGLGADESGSGDDSGGSGDDLALESRAVRLARAMDAWANAAARGRPRAARAPSGRAALLGAALSRWRRGAARRRRVQWLIDAAVVQWLRGEAARALFLWVSDAAGSSTRRGRGAVVSLRRARRQLARAMGAWSGTAFGLRSVAIGAKFYLIAACRGAFRYVLARLVGSARLHATARLVGARALRREVLASWGLWRADAAADGAGGARGRRRALGGRLRSGALGGAFHAWVDRRAGTRDALRGLDAGAIAWRGGAKRGPWHMWSAVSRSWRLFTRAGRALRRREAGCAWRGWLELLAVRQAALATLRQAVDAFAHRELARGWRPLRAATSERRATRRSGAALANRAGRAALNAWAAHADERRRLRRALRAHRAEARALRAWGAEADTRAASMAAATVVGLRWARRHLAGSWSGWWAARGARARARAAGVRLVRGDETRALASWHAGAVERNARCQTLRAALGRWARRELADAMRAWAGDLAEAVLVRRALRGWVAGSLASAWRAWAPPASAGATTSRTATAVARRARALGAARALDAWRDGAAKRATHIQTLRASFAALRHRGLHAAVGSWRENAAELGAAKALGLRIQTARKPTARALRAWHAGAIERAQIRSGLRLGLAGKISAALQS
ncbi:hypothetical protein T492DRAFT_880512, partial [Pavlovales sp. CCMP2436]